MKYRKILLMAPLKCEFLCKFCSLKTRKHHAQKRRLHAVNEHFSTELTPGVCKKQFLEVLMILPLKYAKPLKLI